MNVTIAVNAKEFRRRFRGLKAKSFAFGIKKASDRAGKVFVKAFQREWNRKLDAKRKTFPTVVLRIRPAFVNIKTGLVKRPTRVVNIASNDILNLQMHGGTRKAQKNYLFIPSGGRKRRVSRSRTYQAGKYVFLRKRNELVAHLAKSVNVKGRVDLRYVIDRTERAYRRLLVVFLTRELRFRQRRG